MSIDKQRIKNIFEPTEIRKIQGGYEFRTFWLFDISPIEWKLKKFLYSAQQKFLNYVQRCRLFIN